MILDEGTCGRRLAVTSGFKALTDCSKLSCSYMSFTYPYVRICAEQLLEMSGFVVEFHRVVVVHKLESLIMAQNERWRHA